MLDCCVHNVITMILLCRWLYCYRILNSKFRGFWVFCSTKFFASFEIHDMNLPLQQADYLIIFDFSIYNAGNILLMYTINTNGLKIDPCSTPDDDLQFAPIREMFSGTPSEVQLFDDGRLWNHCNNAP